MFCEYIVAHSHVVKLAVKMHCCYCLFEYTQSIALLFISNKAK